MSKILIPSCYIFLSHLLNTVYNEIFSLQDTMSWNMIIVLASTKEVISDFMINMNIDSLGENHIDVALKVPFSL